MRTTAKKNIRQTSPAEILSSLTKSLAFQVQMIMWEDRKSQKGRHPGAVGRYGCRIKEIRSADMMRRSGYGS